MDDKVTVTLDLSDLGYIQRVLSERPEYRPARDYHEINAGRRINHTISAAIHEAGYPV